MEKNTYYITTPIYYPSGKWHLGHSYTTVCCDAIARYKRMQGYDVFYLTGTDEHGVKIAKRAEEAGVTPKQFVDVLADDIKRLWELLHITNNKFIRTTDEYHKKAVSKIFKTLFDKGDIYKSTYSGMYCTPCESFWTESQLKDGKCPDCGREVQTASEEAYFFRLSKYAERVEKLLTTTDFLQPQSRVNEMVNNFIKPGLADLCVSRTSYTWGVPVEFDKGHVVYVWIDALSNYITALGAFGEDDSLFKRYWAADLHMVGKEIVRFHAIIWPALLMALDIPLPKKVYGHGWLLLGGDKMSKSKGNVVDPFILVDRYGLDAVRYYLLREIPFGADGVYSNESFLTRVNADLVNDLSNLVSRSTAMCVQYFGGVVPCVGEQTEADREFVEMVSSLHARVEEELGELNISRALEAIFKVIGRANKYIDETTPWKLKGDIRLNTIIYNLLECIRVCAVLLSPFIPDGADKILTALAASESERSFESVKQFGGLGQNKVENAKIYMRIDIPAELKALGKLAGESEGSSDKNVDDKSKNKDGKDGKGKDGKNGKDGKGKEDKGKDGKGKEMITIDDFAKVELRTGLVTACEKVEGADKLLKLTVALGGEVRTIVSGIAKYYSPDEVVGRSVVVVANLLPVKLRGILSEGMILCASEGNRLVLVSPSGEINSGAEVR